MSEKSNYEITKDEKTSCKCGQEVELLKPKWQKPYLPAFYICFACKTVGEVGVAPVARA